MVRTLGLEAPHPMDKNYSHKCFKCQRELKWSELLNRNLPSKTNQWKRFTIENYKKYRELKKWWRAKYVQFYCCSCYERRAMNINRLGYDPE